MRIQDIGGEYGLIDRLTATHGATSGTGLVLGLGDDAAVISVPSGQHLVVTTDMLVEHTHFRREWSDLYSIGWKAAAVNLSDIAGMGAIPTFAFISIAFTNQETVENLDRLYDGFIDCLNRYAVRLAGGDTNVSPDNLVISVTLLGKAPVGKALTRSGARVGDILLVTGHLGDSAAGLALLTEYGLAKAEKTDKDLINIHRRPQPRIVAGRAAAATGKIRAAMDISDGIVNDLKKMCAASGVGARIDSGSLPISELTRNAAVLLHKNAVHLALDGGEDYELLLAVAAGDVDEVKSAIVEAGTDIAVIGEITKSGFNIVDANGEALDYEMHGWNHFS